MFFLKYPIKIARRLWAWAFFIISVTAMYVLQNSLYEFVGNYFPIYTGFIVFWILIISLCVLLKISRIIGGNGRKRKFKNKDYNNYNQNNYKKRY